MTHFNVWVFVSDSYPGLLEEEVETLLAPFNEEEEFSPRPVRCHCCGDAAEDRVRDLIEAMGLGYNTLKSEMARKEKVSRIYKNGTPEEREVWSQKTWRKLYSKHEKAEKELMAAQPDKDSPKPDCKECNGTGLGMTSGNPQGYWDWYVIGGRWDGSITGQCPVEDKDSPTSHAALGIQANIMKSLCLLESLSKETGEKESDLCIPRAVVMDGKWIARARTGWWGATSDEVPKKVWRKKVLKLLKQAGDVLVVNADCHT